MDHLKLILTGEKEPTCVSSDTLKKITKHFSPELVIGRGGFGVVYKGFLGNRVVAVKKFSNWSATQDAEFDREVKNMLYLKHDNIVRFLGYCSNTHKEYTTYDGKLTAIHVLETMLCFEFASNGNLREHITGDFKGYEWDTRYKIIKGICQGLHYLHRNKIIHRDLKPENILLDEHMEPKIADFGLSKVLGNGASKVITGSRVGTDWYIAPEFLSKGVESYKYDIYSLGIVITEIVTGLREKPDEEEVCTNWKNRIQEESYAKQVRICIKIALRCVEDDREKRPSIEEIISKLNELETVAHSSRTLPIKPVLIPAVEKQNELLDAHPRQLRFPCFEANKLISCPLRLSNNTDNDVAFRFLPKVPDNYRDGLSLLNGIVPQRSTHTYLVWLQKQPPVNLGNFDVTLESCIAHKDIDDVDDNFLPDVLEQTGNKVHQVTLMAAIRDTVGKTSEPIQPGFTKVLCRIGTDHRGHLTEIDVHPTKPWILASYYLGGIIIWNFETQERVTTLRTLSGIDCFRSTKFIAREKWFLAGDWYGSIHVRSCVENNAEVKRFKAHDSVVISLAVHPSEPLLLSSGGDERIKLWNWEANWQCIRTLRAHTQHVEKVIFNPMDSNVFASTGLDGTVKIWSISSPLPTTTLDCHQQNQLCVDYFHPGGDQQYMVTGSSSGNARIWDLKTNTCVRQINGLQSGNSRNVGALDCFPHRQLLVTNLEGNLISVYNFSTDGYENTVDFKLGDVLNFTYINRIKSVAIGFSGGIAMMEIN